MGAPLSSLRRGVLPLLVLLAVALAVAGCGGGGDEPPSTDSQATAAVAMLKGVQQDGARLGAANAPAKLTLFTSLTELNTAFVRSDLPVLVRRFVKPGLLQIEMVTVDRDDDTTVSDSGGARQLARVAQSAALRDHLWDFYVAFETYYDGTYQASQTQSALAHVPSITPAQILGDARGAKVTQLVSSARARGSEAPGVLPSFVLRGPEGGSQLITGDCLQCLPSRVAKTLGKTTTAAPAKSVDARVKQNLGRIRGIPQDGITLGRLTAPATLSVYLAPGEASEQLFTDALPDIVRRWVRPGKLRIQVRFEPPAQGQADAEATASATRLATSAGVDDHLWDFLAALSARYSGSLDAKLLSSALADVGGLDAAKVRSRAASADITGAIARGVARGREIGVTKVPAYVFDARRANNKKLDGSCSGCLLNSITQALAAEGKPRPKRSPTSTPAPVRTARPTVRRPSTPVATTAPRAPAPVRTQAPSRPQPTATPRPQPQPQKTAPPKIPIKPQATAPPKIPIKP